MAQVLPTDFGEGSGEEFFMGPYLDVLPNVLMKRVRAVGE